jgi:hypothetical protein
MKKRCRVPSCSSYKNYGGRGINYDDRWEFFEGFYADMGDPPTDAHTLERRDNNLGYSKENCCWATRSEQNLNRRNNRLLELGGISKPLTVWARERGISPSTVRSRIFRHGWTVEEALSGNRT